MLRPPQFQLMAIHRALDAFRAFDDQFDRVLTDLEKDGRNALGSLKKKLLDRDCSEQSGAWLILADQMDDKIELLVARGRGLRAAKAWCQDAVERIELAVSVGMIAKPLEDCIRLIKRHIADILVVGTADEVELKHRVNGLYDTMRNDKLIYDVMP